MKQHTGNVLRILAERADRRYAETVKSRTGRDRWTMKAADESIPEIREALAMKVRADDAWISWLRHHSRLINPLNS